MAVRLACQVQLPFTLGGLEGCAVYLNCGEGDFPIKRLSEIASNYSIKYSVSAEELLDGVFIENVSNVEQLEMVLKFHLPSLIPTKNVRLVIIDSIAGLFRSEYGEPHLITSRSNDLFRMSSIMKRLSSQNSIPFVCINQVKKF